MFHQTAKGMNTAFPRILTCCLLAITVPAVGLVAQVPVQIEMGQAMNAAGSPISDGMMVYGSESLKKNITYADVKGSPFINDSFRISILFDDKNKVLAKLKSRINAYSQQLHYLDMEGREKAVNPDLVRRVQYVDPFNEKLVLQEFSASVNAINDRLKKLQYVQVMNSGETRLIKHITKYVTTYDSMMGLVKRYMFAKREDYYLQRQQTVEPLRKLNKERILAFTRYEKELTEVADKEKLDFRKEEDVAILLTRLGQMTDKK